MLRNITAKQEYGFLGKLTKWESYMIPNRVLKLAAPHISISSEAILNKHILHIIFPDDLKAGKAVPISKGDEKQLQYYLHLQETLRKSFAINSLNILTVTIFYVMDLYGSYVAHSCQ